MIFRIPDGVVPDKTGPTGAVQIVGPSLVLIDFHQPFVGIVTVNGVKTGFQEAGGVGFEGGEFGVGVGYFQADIALVTLRIEKGFGIPLAGASQGPMPEFRGHNMGDVAAEAVDAHLLPVGEDGIHFFPETGNGDIRVFDGGVFALPLGALGEVVAVVEFNCLVPAVLAGQPGVLVVSGHAGTLGLGGKESVDLFLQAGETIFLILPNDLGGGGERLFFLGVKSG